MSNSAATLLSSRAAPARARRRGVPVVALTAAALTLAACSGGASGDAPDGTGGSGTGSADGDAAVSVATAFYPLAWVTAQVGGDRVDVTDLTPPGTDEHDLELSPATVDSLSRMDLVVYLADFQPAVDDAAGHVSGPVVYDVGPDADLLPRTGAVDDEHADEHDHAGETAEEHAEHADGHAADGEDDHAHGAFDPHFWLDPERLADVADGVAERLATVDPDGAETYRANAERVTGELDALATTIDDGLAQCTHSAIVVTHQAYGYLTQDHGITQIGIAGIDPDTEPSPARIAEIERAVADSDATTVFGEVQVDQKVADVIAEQTGLEVGVLDPLGSQVAPEATYPGQMQKNLDALRVALDCA